MLRQTADFGEGDEVNGDGDDEQPRLAGHQEENSQTQNQDNHQINQSRQCQFHW